MSDAHEDLRRLRERGTVLRAQAGDREAFHELVTLYQDRLMYYVHRLVSDTSDARDLLQDIWLDVFRKLGRLESPAAFRVWLYRIAHHRAVTHIRRQRIEARAQNEVGMARDDAPSWNELDLLENAELVHYALEQLTLEHREVMALRYLEGMDLKEISCVIDCPEGTAKSRLHYAKAAMRRIIEKERADG